MREKIRRRLISLGMYPSPDVRGHSCIIMYHGIDRHELTDLNSRFFSQDNFARHISFYKRRYNVLSLDDLGSGIGLRNDRLNVAITFDDGYQNNYLYALPVLEHHECPATFFITGLGRRPGGILWADLLDICGPRIQQEAISFQGVIFPKGPRGRFNELRAFIKNGGFLGTEVYEELKTLMIELSGVDLSSPIWQDYFRLMTDEEIAAMARSRHVRIGSHGMYHNNLGIIPHQQAVEELNASKTYLEDVTDMSVDSVGYPDGSYTVDLARAAYDMGFRYQCAVNYTDAEDGTLGYLHDRIGLYPKLSIGAVHHGIAAFSR